MSTVPEPHGEPAAADEAAVEEMLAFLPIHKRAMGVACGLVGGTILFGITVFAILVLGDDPPGLYLIGEYFYGYEVSWKGAFIGFFWAFVTCFVFGWFAAFMHNFVVAASIFIARTREELNETRDFLDHI